MTLVILCVAEKPSIAETIAKTLSSNTYKTRFSRVGATKVHEYQGFFRGVQALFKVTSVLGHVYNFDFVQEYNNWKTVDAEELFFAGVRKVVADASSKVVKHLEKEATGSDYVILWLDCDREGENIAFEVISCVQSFLRSPAVLYGSRANVYRAKFSALTKTDIQRAMENLTFVDGKQAASVDVRAEIDLKVGVAFTRFQTLFFQEKYAKLDAKLISYGPCQTPTLGFCVARYDEIVHFIPETFYVLSLQVEKQGVTSPLLNRLEQSLMDCIPIAVSSVSVRREKRKRPLALNTVELLKLASRRLKLSPHRVAHIAESLYTQGLVSYPRTESTKYPSCFDFASVLMELKRVAIWKGAVQKILETKPSPNRAGVDKGDHPPITPVRGIEEGNKLLDADHLRVYHLIVGSFLASISQDAMIEHQQFTICIGGEDFVYSTKKVISAGWLELNAHVIDKDDEWNTKEPKFGFMKDEILSSVSIQLEKKETNPPVYLSESDLVELMERHGIGTDASIPTHIQNILDRNYVYLNNERRLVPTQLGILLYRGYQKIDYQLVSPMVRSHIEKEISQVAQGLVPAMAVVEHSLNIFWKKFVYFRQHIDQMDELFETAFTGIETTGKMFSLCGHCHRYMKLIESKRSCLFCLQCNENYNLPSGKLQVSNGNRCNNDSFELILWTSHWGRPCLICPLCYQSEEQGMKEEPSWFVGMGCTTPSHCQSVSCAWLPWHKNTFAICPACVESVENDCSHASVPTVGMLFLNPYACREVFCTHCQFSLEFSKSLISTLEVCSEASVCHTCQCRMLSITYQQTANKESQKTCLLCNVSLSSLVMIRKAKMSTRKPYRKTNHPKKSR
eukprot:jgi/Galph1/1605/GphlegSOOS_G286.1